MSETPNTSGNAGVTHFDLDANLPPNTYIQGQAGTKRITIQTDADGEQTKTEWESNPNA